MSDAWEQLERYRQVRALPDGRRLLLRPLASDDKQGLLDLFARASREDLEHFRSDAHAHRVRFTQVVVDLDLHEGDLTSRRIPSKLTPAEITAGRCPD